MSDRHLNDGLWVHRVRFDQAAKGLKVDVSADEALRARIASDFGMISLDRLDAHIETAGKGTMVQVALRLSGDVTQECGVSLEPFSHPISADLDINCIEKNKVKDEVAEIGAREFTLEDLDEPDLITDGHIDLGQYAIEALGDAYDPFARKPGVVFEEPELAKEPSPFAVLARLKDKDAGDA